jgi:hypothetical protein
LNDSSEHPWNEFTNYSNQCLPVWTRWCLQYQLNQLNKFCLESNLGKLNWGMEFPGRMRWFFWGSFKVWEAFESQTDKIYHDFYGRKWWSLLLNSLFQRFSLPNSIYTYLFNKEFFFKDKGQQMKFLLLSYFVVFAVIFTFFIFKLHYYYHITSITLLKNLKN